MKSWRPKQPAWFRKLNKLWLVLQCTSHLFIPCDGGNDANYINSGNDNGDIVIICSNGNNDDINKE